ncbi:MAG: MoxR family ATPase [Lachnospiraceae bacterium]|nr:MoxR family ATPase [Lachnospiraceae bacterium]
MINRINNAITECFVGKDEVVKSLLTCLLAGGHVLLEDVPGVGKTTLAKTLSRVIGADFGRIQFTPDTMPSDVTGVSVYNAKTGEFEVKPGAIMHEIVLADEINRTTPKTQSALLEAMSEGHVTVDATELLLPDVFMVIATQNPIEFMGTYPLAEAFTDRFMMRLSIGYPDKESEIKLTGLHLKGMSAESAMNVCSPADIIAMRKEVDMVTVSKAVIEYAENIVTLTRESKDFTVGASPRAMLSLIKAAQATAFLDGRDFVKPDDIKACAVNVFHHRLTLTSEARIRKESIDKLITALVLSAKIPMERES